MGGCTWFHTFESEKTFTAEGNRALKEQLVKSDRAHAAVVFDGDEAVAWAQYGPPGELKNIHHRKEYEQTLDQRFGFRVPPPQRQEELCDAQGRALETYCERLWPHGRRDQDGGRPRRNRSAVA